MILLSVVSFDASMGVRGFRHQLLTCIAAGRKAGAVHLLLDARSGRGRGGCLLRTFPAVGVELVAGAAGLGPIVLTATGEREGPEQRDQGNKRHSPSSPHRRCPPRLQVEPRTAPRDSATV